jgi:hypothetical protein
VFIVETFARKRAYRKCIRKCRVIYSCDARHVSKQEGSLSAPVISHGKFVLSFYCIVINVCRETGVRKSAEKFHPFYAAAVFP